MIDEKKDLILESELYYWQNIYEPSIFKKCYKSFKILADNKDNARHRLYFTE